MSLIEIVAVSFIYICSGVGVAFLTHRTALFLKTLRAKKYVRAAKKYINRRHHKVDREIHIKIEQDGYAPSIQHQVSVLMETCEKTRSPLAMFLKDNQKMELITNYIGNEFELIRHISEATDKDPRAEEIMQILAKYYVAKFQNDR